MTESIGNRILGPSLGMEDQKITTFQELADFVETKLN